LADKTAILTALSDLYANSPTAQGLMDDMVSSGVPLRIGQSSVDTGKFTGTSPPSAILGFNLGLIGDLYYINEQGKLVLEIPALTFIHEVAHASRWANSLAYADPNAALLNNADYDQDGAILPLQNAIAQEMGWANNGQASYFATVLNTDALFGTALIANHDYTNENDIDNARFGSVGNDTLSHASNTTNLRDLMFGFGGTDQIEAGLGHDYVYGGDGQDTIEGGDGDDVLYGDNFNGVISGGSNNDTIEGGDGNDFIDGGPGTNTIDGGDGADVVALLSAASAVTIVYTAGAITHDAADTLTAIEGIVGTIHDDEFTLDTSFADGLFAGMAGEDVFYIVPSSDDGALFLQLGADDDKVVFELGEETWQWIALLDAESGDELLVDTSNITTFIAGAPEHETNGDSFFQTEIWFEDVVPGGMLDKSVSVTKYADDPWVEIAYWDTYTNTSFTVWVMDFESGDFGISTTVHSDTGVSARDAALEFAIDWTGLPNVIAAAQSDHMADLLGLSG
jgi:Ca2+-binding RTX toxin-like protein